MKKPLAVVIGLLAFAVIASGATLKPARETQTEPQLIASGSTGEMHFTLGSQLLLPLDELARRADLVVIGTAGSDIARSFNANVQVPAEFRRGAQYVKGAYHDVSFRVIEYLKGSGPDTLSIVRSAPSDVEIVLDESSRLVTGRQYVVFLEKGVGLWTGGYYPIGSQAVGVVGGSSATFPTRIGTVPIAELRRVARENAQPPQR